MMVSTGTDVDQIDLAEVRRLAGGTYIPWHLIGAAEFSPDGRIFAAGSANGTLLLWDLEVLLPHPEALTRLSGDIQKGLPDSTLAQPFIVSVLDQNGDPFAGATVTFTVTAGGGFLSATTATTDENGLAAATLTLGSDPGRNTVTARVAELKPVIFGATALSVPTSLAKVSGDKQEGPAGAALSEPLVRCGPGSGSTIPLEGALVIFRVTAGGGTLTATTDTTDANGRAAATLTLGSLPGANTVSVRGCQAETGGLHRHRAGESPKPRQALRGRAAGSSRCFAVRAVRGFGVRSDRGGVCRGNGHLRGYLRRGVALHNHSHHR